MGMVCAVSFTRHGKLHYLDPGPYAVAIGDKVLVPTDGGTEVAECVWAASWVSEADALPVVAGLAGPEDLAREPGTRRLWSLAEYPRKRFVYSIDLDAPL